MIYFFNKKIKIINLKYLQIIIWQISIKQIEKIPIKENKPQSVKKEIKNVTTKRDDNKGNSDSKVPKPIIFALVNPSKNP